MSQVKIRLSGLPEDVEAAARVLRADFRVLEESADYPNRNSAFVRRYLTVDTAQPRHRHLRRPTYGPNTTETPA